MGASISLEYLNGFQPKYVIKTATYELSLIVYGSYKSWSPMPTPIKELINWGKPDFIAYDSENDKILFAHNSTTRYFCNKLFSHFTTKILKYEIILYPRLRYTIM